MSTNGNNQQIDPQVVAQVLSVLQQQNQTQNQTTPMMIPNWNMPTNPFSAMWLNNMMSMMNNQNQNQSQQQNQNPVQNNTQPVQQDPPTENTDPAVRMVKSPEEIKADEIPMNGSIRLFLQEDMNVIYGKRWTNNGVIENIRYVREDDPPTVSTETPFQIDQNAFLQAVSDMVDQKLNEFRKEYNFKQKTLTSKSTKKEVIMDGD